LRHTGPVLAQDYHRVGARQPFGDRFAQRSRRDDAAVAIAGFTIDNDDGGRFCQAWILVTVIHDDDLRALGRGCFRAGDPVGRHPTRGRSRQQQRLVADFGGVMDAGYDPHRPFQLPAITKAEKMNLDALGDHVARNRLRDRCFAGPAGHQITDANDRHGRPLGAHRQAPQPTSRRIDGAQRHHQRGQGRGAGPESGRAH
jgi:hypothetical protein